MLPKKFLILFCWLSVWGTCHSQEIKIYSDYENRCINVFNDFISYLGAQIKNKPDITDSTILKSLLTNYLFLDNKSGATVSNNIKNYELSNEQLNFLKSQVTSFYHFLQERENQSIAENITVIPIRISNDTFVYNRLTPFQQRNTFVFYDKRSPRQTLGYILFIPVIPGVISSPKIWSWTLTFKFGKYLFRSLTGKEGEEYIFSDHHVKENKL